MFALDGFGEESYEENDGGDIDGAGVAFPQSDDEEISTDGEGGTEGGTFIQYA